MRDAFTELIDPACVADVFVEGIGEIERIGTNCIRMTMFASHSIGGSERERVVVARLVMTTDAFARGIRQCKTFRDGGPLLLDVESIKGAWH